jgi:hypothetical protein
MYLNKTTAGTVLQVFAMVAEELRQLLSKNSNFINHLMETKPFHQVI